MSPEREEGGRDKDRRVRKYRRRSLDRPPDGVVVGGRDAAGPWRKESLPDRRAHPEPERPADEGEDALVVGDLDDACAAYMNLRTCTCGEDASGHVAKGCDGFDPNWHVIRLGLERRQLRTANGGPWTAAHDRALARLRASRPTEGGEDAPRTTNPYLTTAPDAWWDGYTRGRRDAKVYVPADADLPDDTQAALAAVARAASSLGEREALEARLARAAHMLGAVLTRSAADDFDRDRVSESFDEVQAVRRALTSQEVEG